MKTNSLDPQFLSDLPNELQRLLGKYQLSFKWYQTYLIKTDNLTYEELQDLKYVEDRILTHLEDQDQF